MIFRKFFILLLFLPIFSFAQKKIALVPFKGVDTSYCSLLKKEIETFYNCKVDVKPAESLPVWAFYKPRYRFKADSLLKYLKNELPSGYTYILGITNKDISTKDDKHEDWGIFGLGFIGGPSCVVSDFRLKPSAADRAQLEDRLVKVTLHELGHTFGLEHCTADPKCLMEAANGTIQSVDQEKKYLCPKCLKKLSK